MHRTWPCTVVKMTTSVPTHPSCHLPTKERFAHDVNFRPGHDETPSTGTSASYLVRLGALLYLLRKQVTGFITCGHRGSTRCRATRTRETPRSRPRATEKVTISSGTAYPQTSPEHSAEMNSGRHGRTWVRAQVAKCIADRGRFKQEQDTVWAKRHTRAFNIVYILSLSYHKQQNQSSTENREIV